MLNSNSAEFIENLTNELAGMVPTNPNRLKFIKYQSVSSTSSLLLFEILKPSNGDVEINVSQIADNLNVLIKNKAITGISQGTNPQYLLTKHMDSFLKVRNEFDKT